MPPAIGRRWEKKDGAPTECEGFLAKVASRAQIARPAWLSAYMVAAAVPNPVWVSKVEREESH